MAYSPDKRKTNPWYKIWKAIFKYYIWLCGFVLLGGIIPPLGPIVAIPAVFALFNFPLFLVSFFALFIMRENDRERARIYQEILKKREQEAEQPSANPENQ